MVPFIMWSCNDTLKKYFDDTLPELLQFMKARFGLKAKTWEDHEVELDGYANKHVDKYDDQVISLATLFADMRTYYSTNPDKTGKRQSERNQRLVAPRDKKAKMWSVFIIGDLDAKSMNV